MKNEQEMREIKDALAHIQSCLETAEASLDNVIKAVDICLGAIQNLAAKIQKMEEREPTATELARQERAAADQAKARLDMHRVPAQEAIERYGL